MKKKIISFIILCFVSNIILAQSKSFKEGRVTPKNYNEEIPFEFIRNKIILPVEIEGKTYRFLLDTGAPNMVSRELVEAHMPEALKDIQITDANQKKQKLDLVSLKVLKIGTVTFNDFSALVFDFKKSKIFNCMNIDGFIGSNLFRKSIIQIDAQKKVLRFTNKIKNLDVDKSNALKMKLVNNQSSPYVWVKLEGEQSGKEQLLIDTGMTNLYDLSSNHYNIFKKKSIFKEIGESEGASSIGLFGESKPTKQVRLYLQKMQLGDFEMNNIITHTGKDNNSRIGAEILNYGVMTIDFKSKRFYFKGENDIIDVSELEDGFTKTLKGENIVVGYVWDTNLKSKLTYGDQIIKVNDKDVAENFCDFVVKSSKLKTYTMEIKTKDGSLKSIEVEKKPLSEILTKFNVLAN